MVVHLACGADGSDDASDEFIVVDHPHEVSPSAAGAAPALPRSGGDHTVGVTTWKTSVDLWVNGVSTLHSSLFTRSMACSMPTPARVGVSVGGCERTMRLIGKRDLALTATFIRRSL
jgi:hypothetical protein